MTKQKPICADCGREFTPKSDYAAQVRRFCSALCRLRAYRKKQKAAQAAEREEE